VLLAAVAVAFASIAVVVVASVVPVFRRFDFRSGVVEVIASTGVIINDSIHVVDATHVAVAVAVVVAVALVVVVSVVVGGAIFHWCSVVVVCCRWCSYCFRYCLFVVVVVVVGVAVAFDVDVHRAFVAAVLVVVVVGISTVGVLLPPTLLLLSLLFATSVLLFLVGLPLWCGCPSRHMSDSRQRRLCCC